MPLGNKIKKNILTSVSFVFILLLVFSTLMLVFQIKKRQNIKSRALNPTAVLSFAPNAINKSPGETFTVNLILNTNNQPVIGGDFLIIFNTEKLTLTDIVPVTSSIFKTYSPIANNNIGSFDKTLVREKANSTAPEGMVEFGMVAFDPALNEGAGGATGSFTGVINPVAILTFQVKTGASGTTVIFYKYLGSGNTTDTNIIADNNGTPEDILADSSNSVVNVTLGSTWEFKLGWNRLSGFSSSMVPSNCEIKSNKINYWIDFINNYSRIFNSGIGRIYLKCK